MIFYDIPARCTIWMENYLKNTKCDLLPRKSNGGKGNVYTKFITIIPKKICYRTPFICSWWTNGSWWHHQMEIFSALMAICAGNSPVTAEFLAQRAVMRSSDVFFDLRLNQQLNKQTCGLWFETPSRPLWPHCNGDGQGESNKRHSYQLRCSGIKLKRREFV